MNITESNVETIKNFCEGLHSNPDYNSVIESIENDDDDFTVEGVRFIDSETIDEILADELEGDSYLLGCFRSYVLADATGWPVELIEAAQKGEAYEEIGAAMNKAQIRELANIYSSLDGYGHHFNNYDGSKEELRIGDKTYHVFDMRE